MPVVPAARGLYGFPQGQAFPSALLGFPSRTSSALRTSPPVGDYQSWWDFGLRHSLVVDYDGYVSRVANLATGGTDMTASGSARPAYSVPTLGAQRIGGIQVPYFDGSNNYMVSTDDSSTLQSTMFMVARIDTAGTERICFGTDNSNGKFFEAYSSNQLRYCASTGGPFSSYTGKNYSIVPFAAGARYDGTNILLRMDSAAETSQVAAESGTTGKLAVGRRANSTLYWQGLIAECIFYARCLTTAESDATMAYLKAKWKTP